jgi:hypothetical protein
MLEVEEKLYADARIDARHFDEMISAADCVTRNGPATAECDSDDTLASKAKEPSVFYGVPRRAGDRGRTGDVQLGKLSGPLWGKGFSAAVAEMG